MKKTFRMLVAVTLTTLFGMVSWAQGQLPTDRYGTPIYGNQETYYGVAPLPGGCLSGNCGNHAIGPMAGDFVAGDPCGTSSCGVEPCVVSCEPCFTGPCLPCLPCAPCGGGSILNRIWNGQNYWQGSGCGERVIDEIRKSWQHCRQCDYMGENVNGTGNTYGTGLRSAQIVNMGAPYGPINMNAGQPEKGYYSVPVNSAPAPFQPGGCSSCKKGITVTAMPQQKIPSQQSYIQQQPIQARQTYVQPVQYAEPIQKPSRKTGSFRYRTNYAPSAEVPGYLRAMQNATGEGIGFDSIPEQPQESAWRVVPVSSGKNTVTVLPVNTQMETIATPEPRQTSSVLTSAPGVETPPVYAQNGATPIMAIYPAVPACDDGGCVTPCGDCGPCDVGCGPCGLGIGPYCGAWPGLIPLAADTVRLAGRAVFNTGRAAVIGTGMVARGSLRTVGLVFWNRPLPAPVWGGPVWGGTVVGGDVVVGGAPAVTDPVYAENDYYLNAGYNATSPSGSIASNTVSVTPVSNLYEDGYYPQNYVVPNVPNMPREMVAPNGNSMNSAYSMVADVQPTESTVKLHVATGTANLLSYQTQRVYLEDGTEVILEHDAMLPENQLEKTSVQFASATLRPAVGIENNETSGQISVQPVSLQTAVTDETLKSPDSLGILEDVPTTETISVPETALSEDYPIVATERPQIQLAPGEVLISQEDFILLPAKSVNNQNWEKPTAPATLQATPIPSAVPIQSTPTVQPMKDAHVTKVSFVQPIVPEAIPTTEPERPVIYRATDSGWQVKVTE